MLRVVLSSRDPLKDRAEPPPTAVLSGGSGPWHAGMRSLLTGSPSSAATPRHTAGSPLPSPAADFVLSSGAENRAEDPASQADSGKRKSSRGEERHVRKRFIPLVAEQPVLAVPVCGVPRKPPAPRCLREHPGQTLRRARRGARANGRP